MTYQGGAKAGTFAKTNMRDFLHSVFADIGRNNSGTLIGNATLVIMLVAGIVSALSAIIDQV